MSPDLPESWKLREWLEALATFSGENRAGGGVHAQCSHLISAPLGADTFCTCGEASAHFSEVMRRIIMSPRHQAIVPGQEKSVKARTGTKDFRYSQMAVLGSHDDPLMLTRRQGCLCGVRMLVGVSSFCKNPVLQRLQKIVLQSKGLNSPATRYAWVGFTSSPCRYF